MAAILPKIESVKRLAKHHKVRSHERGMLQTIINAALLLSARSSVTDC